MSSSTPSAAKARPRADALLAGADEHRGDAQALQRAHGDQLGEDSGRGVDLESTAVLGYGNGCNLVLSCGMNRRYDTFTRLLGSDGEIRMTNPFHPSDGDRLEILGHEIESTAAAPPAEPSFSAAIRHIQAVIGGTQEPRHLAIDTSLPTAQALHDLHAHLSL